MNHEDIIKKIYKCIKLSQSPEPAEAAAALAKARELMDRYNIDQKSIEYLEVEEKAATSPRLKVKYYQGVLASTVAEVFGCMVFAAWKWNSISKKEVRQIVFVGIEPHAQIAQYAYVVLERKLTKARNEYINTLSNRYKRATKVRKGDVYCQTWCQVVTDTLVKLVPKQEIDAKVPAYLKEKYELATAETKIQRPGKRDLDAAIRGYLDGQRVDVQPGMDGMDQKQLS